MAKKYRSRKVTKKVNNQARTTTLLVLAVIILIIGLIIYGIPALTSFALFLGDVGSTSTPISSTDTIPPTRPILNSLPQATSSATIDITGFAEAGSQVVLHQQNVKVQETLSSTSGEFEFLDIALDEGNNSFYVIASDDANNQSPQSEVKRTILDTTAPEITIEKPQENQTFYGFSQRTIDITGTTDPETTLYLNDRLVRVSQDGAFSTRIQLEEGDNVLEFRVSDRAGNSTSQEIKVSYRP